MRACHVLGDMNNETESSVVKNRISKLAPSLRVALFAGALAAGISGLAWMHPSQATEATAAVVPVRLSVNERPVARDGKAVTSFAPVIKKVAPSVVKVFVTTKGRNIPGMDAPSIDDPFFRRFFGDELSR